MMQIAQKLGWRYFVWFLGGMVACLPALAVADQHGGGGPYTLFNRAPRADLRPLAAEPHPHTTDPGWLQLEIDPLNYTRNNDSEARTRAFETPLLLKIGVLDNVDFHIGFDVLLYERTRDRISGERHRDRGFGDMMVASKINLWGNDDGDSAAAIMPFMTLPTARHDGGDGGITSGVLLPTAWALNEFWEFDLTPSVAAVRNSDDNGYVAEFGQLSVLTRELIADLSAFVEFECFVTTESGQTWQALAGTGVTWDVSDDTVLETGVGFGLNNVTDDLNVYVKLVQRF